MQNRNIAIVIFCVLAAALFYYKTYSGKSPAALKPGPYESAPPTKTVELGTVEKPCSDENSEWRPAQVIDEVNIAESPVCEPDNPAFVAAVVKGTDKVSHETLMRSGLSYDAVLLDNDRDNDGDPDVVTIKLEVAELNGRSTDMPMPVPQYSIAPGIQPGFWTFVPKPHGMATKDIVSMEASGLLRMPSPTIRIEQGDTVRVVLENTHYLPHSIHFHGVDHPYYLDHPMSDEKRGNDGVPETSHHSIMPGNSFTYEMTPRVTGSMLYHCHEQPPIHVMMGLFGMFVVEENKPNNWVQTLNLGAGQVRHPSVAINQAYAREYDLFYQEIDMNLGDMIKKANDPRIIQYLTTRGYNATGGVSEYFMLNGKAFPYTLRESIIVADKNEKIKLRMANGGDDRMIAIHTHGHKLAVTHYDGIEQNPMAWIRRDVFDLAPAQRLDLLLDTTDDGLNSYGPGVWMMHDHMERAITNNGVYPGGNVTLIAYKGYLGQSGLPMTHGVDLKPFFTKEFYDRKYPVWTLYDKDGTLGDPGAIKPNMVKPMSVTFAIGVLIAAMLMFRQKLLSKKEAK